MSILLAFTDTPARTHSHMALSTEKHTQYNLVENSVTPEIFMRYRYTAQPCDVVRYRLRLDIDSTRGNLRAVSLRGVNQSTEVNIARYDTDRTVYVHLMNISAVTIFGQGTM